MIDNAFVSVLTLQPNGISPSQDKQNATTIHYINTTSSSSHSNQYKLMFRQLVVCFNLKRLTFSRKKRTVFAHIFSQQFTLLSFLLENIYIHKYTHLYIYIHIYIFILFQLIRYVLCDPFVLSLLKSSVHQVPFLYFFCLLFSMA